MKMAQGVAEGSRKRLIICLAQTGAAFSTGASVSNGKEVTILTILGPMLSHQMIVVSGGGEFLHERNHGTHFPGH